VTVGQRSSSRSRFKNDEHGSVTVWLLALGLVIVLVAAGLAMVGGAVVARHRAQAAADLAALAGAMRAWDGEAAACDRAADVSARNSAALLACRLDELDVVVTVEVVPDLLGSHGAARASARAGPTESLGLGAASAHGAASAVSVHMRLTEAMARPGQTACWDGCGTIGSWYTRDTPRVTDVHSCASAGEGHAPENCGIFDACASRRAVRQWQDARRASAASGTGRRAARRRGRSWSCRWPRGRSPTTWCSR
jgi:secretion/DNA translocation related TadE-like protein